MSEAQVQSLESVRIALSISGPEAAVKRFDWLSNRATLKTACDAASLRTPQIHWTILKFHDVGEGVCCQAPVGRQKSRPASSFRSGLAHFFSSAVQLFTKVKSDIDPPPIGIGKSMRLPSRVM